MAITAAQLMVKVGADVEEAQNALDRVKQKLQEVSGGAQKAGAKAADFGGFIKGAAQQMLGFSTAMGAMSLVKDAFDAWKGAAIDFNASLEQTSIAFTTMLGSAEASQEMLKDLQRFAAQTPFNFPELVDASRRLLAMGYSAKEVIPMLTDVGNAAAALGLGNEGIDRITLALGQMRAATRVNAQDMRQLTEAGIPAWQILADAIGKTVGETQKLAGEGKIASETFISAFRGFSQSHYGDMMMEQSKTFAGAMSNIADSMTIITAERSKPLFDVLSSAAQNFANSLQLYLDNKDTLAGFQEQLATLNAQGLLSDQMFGQLSQRVKVFALANERGWMSSQQISSSLAALQTQFPELAAAISAAKNAQEQYNQVEDTGMLRNLELAASMKQVKDAVDDLQKQQADQAKQEFEFKWSDSATQIANLKTQLSSLTPTMAEYWQTLDKLNTLEKEHTDAERDLNFAMADHAGKIAILKGELSKLIPGTTEYDQKMKELVLEQDSVTSSTRDLTSQMSSARDALVRLSPAAQAAAAAVTMWEEQITAVNGALRANDEAIRAAQDRLSSMQAQLGNLNTALTEAKQRLDEFSHPRLTGMGEMEMQIGAIEAQIKRIDLASSLGMPLEEIIAKYPLLTQGAEDYLKTLPTTKDELQKLLDQLQLMQSLSYDEKLKLLQQAANPPAAEMSYEEALAGIGQTQGQITSLTQQIKAQEAAIKAQEKAVAALQAVSDRLNETLRQYQDQLQQAQRNQDLVNQGLQLAYTWFLEDRQKMLEMGGTASEQVGIVDQKARELLSGVSSFAGDTTKQSEDTLAGLISSFQTSSAQAVLEVQKNLGNIPHDIYTYHHVVTVYEGSSPPGRASGGPVLTGKPYIVGEEGPEVFVPDVSGVILPARRDGFGAAAGGDVYIDKIVVQGSVMTARGLAEDVRQELIRTMKRNGSVGF